MLTKLKGSIELKHTLAILDRHWLLFFYITALNYLELVYRLWSFKNMGIDFAFPMLFTLCTGGVMYFISSAAKENINRIIAISITLLLTLCYSLQLGYFSIFRTPLSLYSLSGADDAMQFRSMVLSAVLKNFFGFLLVFIPLILLLWLGRKRPFSTLQLPAVYFVLIFCILSHNISVIGVNLSGKNNVSPRALYYNTTAPEISVVKLGLLTTMRLDLQRLVFGFEQEDEAIEVFESTAANITEIAAESEEMHCEEPLPVKYNTMDIDFDTLIDNEKNETLRDMHKYFSNAAPSKQNIYTGMFEGNNLILITAEAFSPYAVHPELTPTLYKMTQEGIVFDNFYNPIWGVSTSDGEYVACTGLIPKSGIWSFARSSQNAMPFVMGNQFKKLNYTTKAYHNHSYTYYKRNLSHPNMGYEYKGLGNGLKVKKTWPESDLEMIELTTPEYMDSQPFHAYYMTVSGHMEYNFDGNFIAKKNKAIVESLSYSETSRAYIACNLELEYALKTLMERLEAAGAADNTVIAISPDHYPYGLPKENIDELVGHQVEENFELYKSTFILWKKGMEPVVIDKPCSSLDINPTLSNLFGLEYDSRLLMGRDILSDSPGLVVFNNRSWITEYAKYNSITDEVTYMDESKKDTNYAKEIDKIVADKFKYSAKILEKDYYRVVLPSKQE